MYGVDVGADAKEMENQTTISLIGDFIQKI